MGSYEAVDLDWQWTGDFAVGEDGDFKDTSYDTIQALIQEIQSVIRSKFKDWKAVPGLAADLYKFRGEPNTRKTGKAIEEKVASILTSFNIVRPEDLSVRVVPVHIHQVTILIKINALATPQNSLVLGNPVVLAFIYDSVEDSVFYLPENQVEQAYKTR